MIKDYFVNIPPHLSEVLQDLGNTTSDDFDTIIAAGRTALFNFTYPVSTADKQDLEEFILNYYIMRRIGSGNVKKWRQMLKAKMLEIMPYYKQLLDSEKLTFNPLINNDIETNDTGTLDTTRDKTVNSNGSYNKGGTENANSTEVNRYLDTPQGNASAVWEQTAGGLNLTNHYLTDIRGITNNGTRTWSESGTDTNAVAEHEVVDTDTTNKNTKLGVSNNSKSNLLKEYRETFLRIYEDIARELEPIFYNLVEIDDILDYV